MATALFWWSVEERNPDSRREGAAMIIYGWGEGVKALGEGFVQACGNCGRISRWVVADQSKRFSLYFVPIVKWNHHFLYVCPACTAGIEIPTRELALRIVAAAQRNPRGPDPALAEALCRSLGLTEWPTFNASQGGSREAGAREAAHAALAECYRILDVRHDASWDEIKEAHKLLNIAWHPDRFPGGSKVAVEAQQKLKKINGAFAAIRTHFEEIWLSEERAQAARAEAELKRRREEERVQAARAEAEATRQREHEQRARVARAEADARQRREQEERERIARAEAEAKQRREQEERERIAQAEAEAKQRREQDERARIARTEAAARQRHETEQREREDGGKRERSERLYTACVIEERESTSKLARAGRQKSKWREFIIPLTAAVASVCVPVIGIMLRSGSGPEPDPVAPNASQAPIRPLRPANSTAPKSELKDNSELRSKINLVVGDDESRAKFHLKDPRRTGTENAANADGKENGGAALLPPREAVKPSEVFRLIGEGHSAYLKTDYAEAALLWKGALMLDPDNIIALNNLAWLYATCPRSEFRDGVVAVRMARKAVELAGGWDAARWNHVGTLAAAYAEIADFQNAQMCQEFVVKYAPPQKQAEVTARLKSILNRHPIREQSATKE